MRITGGEARGRTLHAIRGERVRPTSSMVRSAIFNIVAARFDLEGAHVLDLFAGTGAMGIEALSRGARLASFVEETEASCAVIRRNLAASRYLERARVVRSRLPRALDRLDLSQPTLASGVFVDPPYRRNLAGPTLDRLGSSSLLEPRAWVFVEHAKEDVLEDTYGSLERDDERGYGATRLSLFLRDEE